MTETTFYKNAKIVSHQDQFDGGILVQGETIVEVVRGAKELKADQVIDLGGNVLMPGVIDGHAHFNEPGRTHWEGYETGTKAAAAGGVTCVLEMPLNSLPATIDREALQVKRATVADKAVIDYGNWGGFVDNNIKELPELNEDGVIGFKSFASNSGVEFERLNDDMIYAGLLETKRLGNVIGLHAENEWVCSYLNKQFKAEGRTDRAAWCESRPGFAELEAVNRAIYWAKVTGGNLHIVHISIPDGVQAVHEARAAGVHVTAETCPHYLFFDRDDFVRIGPAAKCAPPIRTKDEKEELWKRVLEGKVDVIGSDHSPCNWEEKEKGLDNIWTAWGGISGIQSILPAIISEGVNARGLALEEVVRMLSYNPAKLFGLAPALGELKPGADASMVVVDLNKKWTLTKDMLLYRNKFSAYEGYSFTGQVEQTIVRGKTVFQDGKIMVDPGYGQLRKRTSPYSF